MQKFIAASKHDRVHAGLDRAVRVAGELGRREGAAHPAQVLAVDAVGARSEPPMAPMTAMPAVAEPAIHVVSSLTPATMEPRRTGVRLRAASAAR